MKDEEKRDGIYRNEEMVVIGGLGEVQIGEVVGFCSLIELGQ